MASRGAGAPAESPDRARAVALAEELGAVLGRLKGAGPKVMQLLSIVQLDRPETGEPAFGALPAGARAVPFDRVKKVVEKDLEARLRELFDRFDEKPFAVASLGQVHRARTVDGEDVAVKVQHAGVAESVEADLRSLGLAGPILKRLAPDLDTTAVLGEIRERIADELDFEVEAQHQRRLERLLARHPHVRVPRVHTSLCTRRVLVSGYVEGERVEELDEAERDRIGEIVFRLYFGLAFTQGVVAGDPHPDHVLRTADGRVCLLDFGLVRDLDVATAAQERDVLRAVAERDAEGVHRGLAGLGYLPKPESVAPDALLEHAAAGGEWMLGPGVRRIDSAYAAATFELAYPPRSPYFPVIRQMTLPPHALLLRRVEIQLLSVLGALNAGADWGAIMAEYHSGAAPSTELGRAEQAFWERHTRR